MKRVILFVAAVVLMLSPGMSADAAILEDFSGTEVGFINTAADASGQVFNFSASTQDVDLEVQVSRIGSPADDIRAVICDFGDNTNPCQTIIHTSAAITGSTLSTDDPPVAFTLFDFTGATLTMGNDYFAFVENTVSGTYRVHENADGSAMDLERVCFQNDGDSRLGVWDCSTFESNNIQMRVLDSGPPPPTPNEFTTPFDTETITDVPFQPQGTCDQAEEPSLRVTIQHADLGFQEDRIVVCVGDVWAAPNMGAALWNDDYFITLNADNFVELPFDTNDFTVDETGNTNPPPPGAATFCSGASGVFLEGLCDIMVFLFVPQPAAFQQFEDLFDQVRLKPPLGFLTATLDAFNDLEEGTPVETLEGTAALSDYFDPIKTTFTAFLYLLFGFYLLRRVSTINI